MKRLIQRISIFLIVSLGLSVSIPIEARKTYNFKSFLQNQETDRTDSGKWININTPKSFKLLTYYGNPAYFSKRYTYDGSYLNMKFSESDPILRYEPELIVMEAADRENGRPGSNELEVWNHPMKSKYSVVKTFYKTFNNGMKFYMTVLARNDVMHLVTNRQPPLY